MVGNQLVYHPTFSKNEDKKNKILNKANNIYVDLLASMPNIVNKISYVMITKFSEEGSR